jgi:glycosyltransferase involved in cell wall biosynthesis
LAPLDKNSAKTSTMKVLHVIPSISPDLGGPSQVALNLVKALGDLGVDSEIVTTNFGVDVPLYQRVDYVFDTAQNLTAPVWFMPYDPPHLKEFIFSKAATAWLWKNISNYDVIDIHYLFSYLPTCAATIARLKRVPYTIRTMGQLTDWALAQSRIKKKVYSFVIEHQNLRQAAAIHCTAAEEIKDVRNFGVDTLTVTAPLGVNSPLPIADAKDQLRQHYGLAPHTSVVLFLSRLHYKKRPELVIESLQQLKHQGLEVYAILAGSGEAAYLAQLQQLAETLDVADRVIFPGLVTGPDKELLLQGSDLFVLPSYSENFGIAVAEALISGLPVVITPGIQISAAIQAARAGLVVSGDAQSVTAGIAQILESPDLKAELSQRGREFAKSCYSWPAIAQNLAFVYDMLIQKNISLETPFTQLMAASSNPVKIANPT